VLNRRGFNELLTRSLAAATDESPSALILLDIDDFKNVNDSHGHPCGDALLCHVTRVLEDETRSQDCVCRLGGDEFGIVLTRADAEAARLIARRIEEALAERPMFHGDNPIKITVSIGVASTSETMPDAENLLREADRAMYATKRERRSPVALRLVSDV
jgi:diguanylate cyclase (GGDEF)-like protein